MAVLPIVTYPDPVLARVCAPVGSADDVSDLIDDMFETMYAAPGRGLAAPQVGVNLRLFVTDTTWKDGARTPMVFVNPELVAQSRSVVEQDEGCLSIPGLLVPVSRPDWAFLSWRDGNGAPCEERFEGFAAACVQHELDHLNGTLTLDHLPDAARADVLAGYGQALS
ncbi:MAG: peptide deformylase [Sedimentitalea sp.]